MELERITQYVLYVGLNDKDVKRQIVPTEIAEEIAMETIGDCSIERIRGCYTHENGKRVYENTLKISILFRSDEEIATSGKTVLTNPFTAKSTTTPRLRNSL